MSRERAYVIFRFVCFPVLKYLLNFSTKDYSLLNLVQDLSVFFKPDMHCIVFFSCLFLPVWEHSGKKRGNKTQGKISHSTVIAVK